MKIDVNRWYRPQEIADNRFVLNSRNNPQVNFVRKLINDGKLKAQNYATEEHPFWRVLGRDVIQYKIEYEGYKEVSSQE